MGAALFRHRLAVILGFFVVALVVVVARQRVGVELAPQRSPLFLPSGLVCLLAFAFRTTGEARVGAAVYGQQASAQLVTGGPFRLLRHPLYAGTWLFFVGATAPYLPVVVLAVAAALFALALRAIALHEEAGLAAVHGGTWARYAAAVPRFVGVPRGVPVDDHAAVTAVPASAPTASALAAAALSNLGMLSLGAYRVVVGVGAGSRGLGLLNVTCLLLWLVVVVVRRLRRG
jgi:protein-S-isoprenylcysteine O-methyltransferase Ste14